MKNIAILGAGDLGRQIAHIIESIGVDRVVGFYDDTLPVSPPSSPSGDDRTASSSPPQRPKILGNLDNGTLSSVQKDKALGTIDAVMIGIGYRHFAFRRHLRLTCAKRGLDLASAVATSATLDHSVEVALGCVVGLGCVLDQGVRLSANVFLNPGCTLAHDATVGEDSFLGPGVVLSGAVRIGQRCFLGSGTVVRDHTAIEADACTGAGTVVIHTVPTGEHHVGVPSRSLENRPK